MTSRITGLDHVIIAVSDLERAAATFRALGFTLAPRGHHAEWGTANHCIMFGGDYLELLHAAGEGAPADRVRAFLAERGEGLMSLAWGTEDAAADCARLGTEPPAALSRNVEGDLARFQIGFLPPETTPGIASFLCGHLTPEKLRREAWTRHANGALGIVSVTAIMDDPPAQQAAWDRLIGPAASTLTDDTLTVHTRNGMVFLVRPDELGQLHPEAEDEVFPPAPALVALTLRVASLDAAAAVLKAQDIAFDRDRGGKLVVYPEQACGVLIELVD